VVKVERGADLRGILYAATSLLLVLVMTRLPRNLLAAAFYVFVLPMIAILSVLILSHRRWR
jgi:uncharacterized membrane protein YeiB